MRHEALGDREQAVLHSPHVMAKCGAELSPH